MTLSAVFALIICFVACFAAAASGAVFRPGAWYKALKKPSWTPPNWMFPVVWSVLFTMMSVACWLIWQADGIDAWPALTLFGLHLAVNAAWSALFFGQRRLDWAMVDVVILWGMILALILVFSQISLVAGMLLVPYLIWVTIAASLNASLLHLNGRRGGN